MLFVLDFSTASLGGKWVYKREMMELINIMLSSTVKYLIADRDAIIKAFEKFPLINIVGAEPVRDQSFSASPYLTTLNMAEKVIFLSFY